MLFYRVHSHPHGRWFTLISNKYIIILLYRLIIEAHLSSTFLISYSMPWRQNTASSVRSEIRTDHGAKNDIFELFDLQIKKSN